MKDTIENRVKRNKEIKRNDMIKTIILIYLAIIDLVLLFVAINHLNK